MSIQTGGQAATWPFAPDSYDFSTQGACTITITGDTGVAMFKFAGPKSPTIRGTIDLTALEAQLSGSPNYLDYDSPSQLGPATSVMLTSPNFTRQKSGIVFLTAQFDGTLASQANFQAALYRDYGTPGQVNLNQLANTPGGLGGTPYASGHIHDTDVLPDNNPHTYTIIVSSTADLTIAAGAANIIVFEQGGPG